MGSWGVIVCIALIVPSSVSGSGLLSSSSLIPGELIHYFHPLSREELRILPGVVQREKREMQELESEEEKPSENFFHEANRFTVRKTIVSAEGTVTHEDCMFIRTKAIFQINFKKRTGQVGSITVKMPDDPEVNGTCALLTDTSKIFIFWSAFNFTIEFVKNPEGNSYYMNRAILVYNTEHPHLKKDFAIAETHGSIHLETRPGKNFFFTPLGHSYVCNSSLDQGPLKLWNIKKNEIQGRMDLSNTKFQPFMVRSHGKWGPSRRCLPHEIREMREDFWPFVSAACVTLFSALTIAVYAIKRTWFTDQKVDYGTYQPTGTQEMEMVRQPSVTRDEETIKEIPKVPVMKPNPSANPFQAKSANPFQQDQANPFH